MKYGLFSIVAGSEICNARCPFCVSRMTPKRSIGKVVGDIDWRNFRKAAALAREGGAQTAMITGKGEPTLYPTQVTEYLTALEPYAFPFVELQTNGILLDTHRETYESHLTDWYERGLTTISISVVDVEAENNRKIYLPNRAQYIDLPRLVQRLRVVGFTVRLSVVMVRGCVDSVATVSNVVRVAGAWGVDQLSFRPVAAPGQSEDPAAYGWTKEHEIPRSAIEEVRDHFDAKGARLQTLPHGAIVYDYEGQNVCLTNCLTIQPDSEQIRQLIFFPTGTIAYDWQHRGAVLLRGRYDSVVTQQPERNQRSAA